MEPCRSSLQTCTDCLEPCPKLYRSFLWCIEPEAIHLPFCSVLGTEQKYFFSSPWGRGEEGLEEMHKHMETSFLHQCNPICHSGKLNEGFPGGKAANPKLGRAGFQHLLRHRLAAWPCTSHSKATCIMVLTYLAPGRKSMTPSWLAAED